MIVTNDVPPSPLKSTASIPGQVSPRLLEGNGAPPPAYGSTSRNPREPLNERQENEPAGGRFIKALCIALLIYLAIGTLIGGMTGGINRKHFQWGPPAEPGQDDGTPLACHISWEPTVQSTGYDTSEYSSISQGSLAGSTFPPYLARTYLDLPVDSPLLFFLARGSLSYGRTRFETHEPKQTEAEDKVKVTIDVRYWSKDARDRANICILQKEEGGIGVGIFTPQRWPHQFEDTDKLQFLVTVSFPASKEIPLSLKSLMTHLPLFVHDVGDLDGPVKFDSLRLRGSNAFIKSKSVRATHITVITSNAPITGAFNATDNLELTTSNGPIDVTIDLENEDHHQATELRLRTTNGRINAASSLYSTKNNHLLSSGGWFKIDAQTSNGRLNLSFPVIPSASHLSLDGRTSNAMSEVFLHPAFEGSFKLSTSNGPVLVDENPYTPDPTGHGLRRNIEMDRVVRGVVEGRVWWGDARDHRELGIINVRTSNGRNALNLM